MAAETNGKPMPTTRNATQRTVGIMRLRVPDVQALGETEQTAADPILNLYLWCRLANTYGQWLHETFSRWWPTANLDFWLAIRLVFVLGQASARNLITTVDAAGAAYRSTAGVQQWLRTLGQGKRFGHFGPFELRQLMNHLDDIRVAIAALDGAGYVTSRFFATPSVFKSMPGATSQVTQGIQNIMRGDTMNQFTA
jgi:hypothetical protein